MNFWLCIKSILKIDKALAQITKTCQNGEKSRMADKNAERDTTFKAI